MSELSPSQRSISARNLLLDLLRTSAPAQWPVSALIAVGDIFGISANAIRVNLSRLLAKQLINTDERGQYYANIESTPLSRWLDRWDNLQPETRPWQQQWLQVLVVPQLDAQQRHNLARACFRLGYREYWQGFWIRPSNRLHNNAVEAAALRELAMQTDSEQGFMLSELQHWQGNATGPDPGTLWQAEALEKRYDAQTLRLEQSIERLRNQPLAMQLRESFLLGGDSIHMLALDPRLPEALCDPQPRETLIQRQRQYDRIFRPLWLAKFQGLETLRSFPRSLEPQRAQRG